MFDIDSNEGDKKIYKIMHTCGLQRSISKKELENSALSALGSYFTTDSFNFKFIHDALEETVGIHFCTLYPNEMFAECDITFIRDRVRIHSNECINVNSDENNLFINVNADENNLFIREDRLKEDCFRPLYTILSNELKRGRFSTLLLFFGGSLDIVKELINTGADVNCFSKSWETPLYIAVKSGRYDMAHLLLRNGALVNIRGWFDMKLPILVTSNNQQLTSLILEYDLNQTEFHKAVRHNDLQQLSLNIPLEYIDSRTRSGWTILHYAVLLNKVEAVKVLFNEELTQNDDYSVEVIQDDHRARLCRKPTPSKRS
ncbi:unnamed protein product [Mytilus edulis]|uniref:Uncharacterized protein n=1 Tax=Mytilus edulis TaxID=6550 RepID=A0A8S3Q4C2_MYTED|nr:unnamed protein product [Mytilus edulis]